VLPVERALGLNWSIENDSFSFRIILKDGTLTRRGILATVSSVYDPLGLAFLLHGKLILQQICVDKKGEMMTSRTDLSMAEMEARITQA